jgi:hypothetical protein
MLDLGHFGKYNTNTMKVFIIAGGKGRRGSDVPIV